MGLSPLARTQPSTTLDDRAALMERKAQAAEIEAERILQEARDRAKQVRAQARAEVPAPHLAAEAMGPSEAAAREAAPLARKQKLSTTARAAPRPSVNAAATVSPSPSPAKATRAKAPRQADSLNVQQPKPKAPPGHRNSQLPSALPLPEDAGHHFFIRCATATHATRPYLTDIHDSTLAFRSNSHCQASGGDQESGSCERSCPDRHDFSDLHGSLCVRWGTPTTRQTPSI